MAVIYDFRTHHTLRLLNIFSQKAEGCVHGLYDIRAYLQDIQACLHDMGEAHRFFSLRLDEHRKTLDQSLQFSRICSAACELESADRMIEARDAIIRKRFDRDVHPMSNGLSSRSN